MCQGRTAKTCVEAGVRNILYVRGLVSDYLVQAGLLRALIDLVCCESRDENQKGTPLNLDRPNLINDSGVKDNSPSESTPLRPQVNENELPSWVTLLESSLYRHSLINKRSTTAFAFVQQHAHMTTKVRCAV